MVGLEHNWTNGIEFQNSQKLRLQSLDSILNNNRATKDVEALYDPNTARRSDVTVKRNISLPSQAIEALLADKETTAKNTQARKMNKFYSSTLDRDVTTDKTDIVHSPTKQKHASREAVVPYTKKAATATKSFINNLGRKTMKRSQSLDMSKQQLLNLVLGVYKRANTVTEIDKATQRRSLSRSWREVNSQSSTSENPRCDNLKDVLGSTESTEAFRKFLVKEFSEENLDFYFAVESYKKQPAKEQPETAKEIYRTYVASGSPNEVNLDFNVRKQTKEYLQTPEANTFDLAQRQIYRLMETDSLRRFSEQF